MNVCKTTNNNLPRVCAKIEFDYIHRNDFVQKPVGKKRSGRPKKRFLKTKEKRQRKN